MARDNPCSRNQDWTGHPSAGHLQFFRRDGTAKFGSRCICIVRYVLYKPYRTIICIL